LQRAVCHRRVATATEPNLHEPGVLSAGIQTPTIDSAQAVLCTAQEPSRRRIAWVRAVAGLYPTMRESGHRPHNRADARDAVAEWVERHRFHRNRRGTAGEISRTPASRRGQCAARNRLRGYRKHLSRRFGVLVLLRNHSGERTTATSTGNHTVHVVPFPGSLSTVMSPPIRRQKRRLIASPSPVPP